MFAMVSSCSARVAVRGDQCLGGQFACAQVHYGIFFTIVHVKKVGCGVFFGDEKGFNLGISTRHRRIRSSSHNHGISGTTTSWTLMSLYSHCRPPFGTSKCTRSIHTSWSTPLCLGSIQILQLAVNEHKNGLQNMLMKTMRVIQRRRMSRSPSTTTLRRW